MTDFYVFNLMGVNVLDCSLLCIMGVTFGDFANNIGRIVRGTNV